jgi:F-type H+-transporting ATPase subunit b
MVATLVPASVINAATSLASQAHAAGLVDVDVTAFVQFIFFIVLVFVLPKLIFEPMLKRFDQRDARTEGARAEARRMLKESDEQVVVFEKAMSDEKIRAMAERSAARMQAQREANEAVAKVRRETNTRIDAGIAALSAQAAAAQVEIDADARLVSALIVQKILVGRA